MVFRLLQAWHALDRGAADRTGWLAVVDQHQFSMGAGRFMEDRSSVFSDIDRPRQSRENDLVAEAIDQNARQQVR